MPSRLVSERAFVLVATLLSLVFAAASCADKRGDMEKETTYEIDRVFERGPVSFRVAVNHKEVTIADHVTMLIEARARDGYRVELPRFGEKLEQFGIVDYTTPKPELEESGVVVTRRIYELEPFLSGEYRIPPMTISFWQEGDTLIHELESDTITVAVTSILPEDHAELEIRDIAGPVFFPRSTYPALIIAGAAILVAVLAVLFRRRKKKLEQAPEISPHELAFIQLEQLLESGLLTEKRYREFTAAISDVLRLYIENRFGLKAPERTTEEFLVEAKTGLPVDDERKKIIEEFLHHCDLVKFAALEPSENDVKRTFETCRDFIDATKKEEEVSRQAA